MTSTLSVIALVTRLRSSTNTTYGDAEYREKILNKNHVFGFKQFTNAQHEYNELFKEGDLVFFWEIYYRQSKIICKYYYYSVCFFTNKFYNIKLNSLLIFFHASSLLSRWLVFLNHS